MEKSPIIFIGGPIQYAISPIGEFAPAIRQILETTLTALTEAGFQIRSAHRYEEYGKIDTTNEAHQVCARDFAWMCECDMFIAILPAAGNEYPIRTDGTCVELGWASAMKKPIVLVRSHIVNYSHLVKGLPAVGIVEDVEISKVLANPQVIVDVVNTIMQNHPIHHSAK